MKFKPGQKIKITSDLCPLSKGAVFTIHSYRKKLRVEDDTFICFHPSHWQLIKSKPSKPKVCKHKYPNGISAQEIHQEEKTNYGDYNARYYTKVLVAVCKLCLEKKYI